MTARSQLGYGLAVAPPGSGFARLPEVNPRRRRDVRRAGHSTRSEWLRSNLIAFDERESSPLVNLGTLGTAGDAVATGTRRLVNTGATAYVSLPGVAGNFLSVPDEAALDITGDIEIVRRVAMADWTPAGAGQALLNKGSVSGTGDGYSVEIAPSGAMVLRWYDSGGARRTRTSSAVIPGASAVNGTALWLKWTLDVDNGASGHDVRFWYAADSPTEPSSWTQLGTTSTTAGVTNIAANAQPLVIGVANPLHALDLNGIEYRTIVRNGIGGATVLDVDTSVLTDEGATSFTATTGQTVTINRATGTGYKTEIVLPGSGSRVLNGISDFLEVADNAALDAALDGSWTLWSLGRFYPTSTELAVVAKSANGFSSTVQGAILTVSTGSLNIRAGDGTTRNTATTAPPTFGSLALLAGVRDRSAGRFTSCVNGLAGTPTADSTAGTFANAFPARACARSDANAAFLPARLTAWGIYPGPLSLPQQLLLRSTLVS